MIKNDLLFRDYLILPVQRFFFFFLINHLYNNVLPVESPERFEKSCKLRIDIFPKFVLDFRRNIAHGDYTVVYGLMFC